MKIRDIILEHYNIGVINDIEEPLSGSGNAFIITTPLAKFIAKRNERIDFVKIYNKVQIELTKQNFIQSKIVKTKTGDIITPNGIVVYEYIDGINHRTLNEVQKENVISYLTKYNKALASVNFEENELHQVNYWDQAKSLTYMLNEFPIILAKSELDEKSKEIILKAFTILRDSEDILLRESRQLIHGDLGPDNFIFTNDEVKSIIDFTPEYDHEYYSLCQFVYWNYLYLGNTFKRLQVEKLLNLYHMSKPTKHAVDIFELLLIKATLFRVVGPFLHIYYNNKFDYSKLSRRIKIVETLINEQ